MPNHHKLQVWHRANALSLDVHRAARRIRASAAPGLKTQLLRAVGSIAANVGEGAADRTPAEFAHFVTIAIGSANETETHLLLAFGMELIPKADGARLLDELDQIRRMLFGLRKFLLTDPDQEN
jgi:four helix bundle protein